MVAAGLLVMAFVAATIVAGPFSKEWLYWRTGYPDLGVPFWLGVLVPRRCCCSWPPPWCSARSR